MFYLKSVPKAVLSTIDNSRRHSPYTENPYKGTLSFTLTYCIQIEFFNNAAFYALEDGV